MTKQEKMIRSLQQKSMTKKAFRELRAKERNTWGSFKPVTRVKPSGKIYNRKKKGDDYHE